MEPMQFAYWLQGFAELNAAPPTEDQWQMIREHLATVFNKVTPPYLAPNGPGSVDLSKWGKALARTECAGGPVRDTIFIC